jgi:hypothetical protein
MRQRRLIRAQSVRQCVDVIGRDILSHSMLSTAKSPGHQLINSTEGTSKGIFSQVLQNCKPCLPGQYIINPNTDVCVQCPQGQSSS